MTLNEDKNNQLYKLFRQSCWEQNKVFCVKCKSKKIYKLTSIVDKKRYRCKICSHTFHDYSERWLNKVNLTLLKWAKLIRYFCEGTSATRTAKELRISYPTTLKAFNIIRLSIAQQSSDWKLLKKKLKASSFLSYKSLKNRKLKNSKKINIFGITEKNNNVSTIFLESLAIQELLKLNIKFHKSGCLVFSEKFKKYDYLLSYIKKNHNITSIKNIATQNIKNGFKEYLEKRINKYFGVTNELFPLYLKEITFKFNYRSPYEETDILAYIRTGGGFDRMHKILYSYLTNFAD